MRYANQGYSGAGTAVLGQDELLGYLRNTADAALGNLCFHRSRSGQAWLLSLIHISEPTRPY